MNILLHGGGLDSTALFLRLVAQGKNFHCVHINYGHAASDMEWKNIQYQCRKYGIENLQLQDSVIRALNPQPNKLFGDQVDNYYVESRNITFITLALRQLVDVDTIYLGLDKPVSGTPLPDCSHEFMQSVQKSFNVNIAAPLIDEDKEDFCRSAYEFDSEFFDFAMTCWHPV
jgi:7-cyano-7-deazaguanine synthase in queuosine biosynthesis